MCVGGAGLVPRIRAEGGSEPVVGRSFLHQLAKGLQDSRVFERAKAPTASDRQRSG